MHQVYSPRSILLTGATGFVGQRLLTELLHQRTNPIICLIRADSDAEALSRGQALTRDPRVSFVRSDLCKSNLGIPLPELDALVTATREIFHSAASVTFDLPLAEAQRINVSGTQALLSLAEKAQSRGHFERFHHISTAYVAGYANSAVDADYLPNDLAKNFRNTYERTKARAERLLRSQTQVPVTIYRPSIVAGESQTGATCAWNVLYMPMRMIYKGQLPVFRKAGSGRLDCVAVDYVVNGILTLAQHQAKLAEAMREAAPQIAAYHLTAGSEHFTINDFVSESIAAVTRDNPRNASNCNVITPLHWSAIRIGAKLAKRAPKNMPQLRTLRRWGALAERGMTSFSPYEPYTGVNTLFENQYEVAVLRAHGIEMPKPKEYLRRIADYAVRAQFGCKRGAPISPPAETNQAPTAVSA